MAIHWRIEEYCKPTGGMLTIQLCEAERSMNRLKYEKITLKRRATFKDVEIDVIQCLGQ